MKYRRLTNEELQKLEKKFVQFLVANTITATDWELIKQKDANQALKLVDIFSEQMFEATMKKVEFLKFKEAKDIKVFRCAEQNMTLLGLTVSENTPVDFTQSIDLQEVMKHTEGISIYKQEKKYKLNREQEVFKLIENGCQISDGHLFDILEKLYSS